MKIIVYAVFFSIVLVTSLSAQTAYASDSHFKTPKEIKRQLPVGQVFASVDGELVPITKHSLKLYKLHSGNSISYQLTGIGHAVSNMDEHVIVSTWIAKTKLYLKVDSAVVLNKLFVANDAPIDTAYHWDAKRKIPYIDSNPVKTALPVGVITNFSYYTNISFYDTDLAKTINFHSWIQR